MKAIYLFTLIAITSFDADKIFAQELSIKSDTLIWTVNQLTDIPKDTTVSFECEFITFGDSRVLWIQQAGEYSNEFRVSATDGRWTDLNQTGSIEYSVKYMDKRGKLIFSKSLNIFNITMYFEEGGVNTMPFTLQVQSVTKKAP